MYCNEIKPGRYRHFKGNEYEVLCVAKNSETEELTVVYKALYGDGQMWVRPAAMWNETVERDGRKFRRFEYIGPKAKYRAVLFDLDGTILDTLGDLTDAINYSLRCFGLPERSENEVRTFVGNGVKNLVRRSMPENSDDTLFDRVFVTFNEYYGSHADIRTGPYKGTEQVIRALKADGIKLAVISNKGDSFTQALCEKFFGGLFDFVIGDTPGKNRKPAPDNVFEAMEKLGVGKEESVYIGDSEVDVLTAENSGVDLLAVSWGFRDAELLRSKGAKNIISSPDEIIPFIYGFEREVEKNEKEDFRFLPQ